MPIEFQPAAPLVGFDIAQQYGALQQQNQNRQFELARSKAQADLEMQGQQLAQRGYEFDQSQQPSERDQFLADQAAKHQQQQFELQGQLQSQRLTQIEKMEIQRDQNRIAEVNADPNIDQETKNAAIFKIRTGLDPQLMRLQREEAQQRQQAAQDRHELAASQASIMRENERFLSDPTTNIREITHPTTGESMGLFQRNQHSGLWEPIADADGNPIGRGGRSSSGSAAGGAAGRAGAPLSDHDYVNHVRDITREVREEWRDATRREQTDPETRAAPFGRQNGSPITQQQEVARRLGQVGLASNLSSHQEQRDLAQMNRDVARRGLAIPYDTPPERLTTVQSTTLSGFDDARRTIADLQSRATDPNATRLAGLATDALSEAERLFRSYHRVSDMPPAVQRRFADLVETVRQATSPRGVIANPPARPATQPPARQQTWSGPLGFMLPPEE